MTFNIAVICGELACQKNDVQDTWVSTTTRQSPCRQAGALGFLCDTVAVGIFNHFQPMEEPNVEHFLLLPVPS